VLSLVGSARGGPVSASRNWPAGLSAPGCGRG